MKANVGSARFYGFEIELNSVNIQTKNFAWSTGLTYSFNKNKVLSLPDEYKYTDLNGKDALEIRWLHAVRERRALRRRGCRRASRTHLGL